MGVSTVALRDAPRVADYPEPCVMSANVNVTNAARKKKVLLVAANPSTSTVTGWPVGFWWAELTHPYWAFTEAGYTVEIRSPKGGALRPTASATLRTRAATPPTTSSASASRSRPRTRRSSRTPGASPT
jgi:hypothetical protein